MVECGGAASDCLRSLLYHSGTWFLRLAGSCLSRSAGDKPAAVAAVESTIGQLDRHTNEVFEHQPFGRTDTPVVLSQFRIGAGVGDKDRKAATARIKLDLTADIPLLKQACHALEPLAGGFATDLVAAPGG